MKWMLRQIPVKRMPRIESGMPVPLEISKTHQSTRNRHPQSKRMLRKKHNTNFFGIGFSR
jgi:ribosome assembly protein YihI (activator of Der GTPase)